jgi:WS/DGAT/MGAT family acyltransferase
MADEPAATSFAQRMTEAEALMWNVEKDPWFSSNIGTLLVCDRPLDDTLLRRRMAAASVDIPRLREHVVERGGRRTTPVWRTDPEFELDYHVRSMALAEPGDRAQLLELATRAMQDPFDRTRPLWLFVAIDGLEDGRGALLVKLHHAITDGQGGIRLAGRYMDIERDPGPVPDVDLDAVITEAVAKEQQEDANTHDPLALSMAAFQLAEQNTRKQFGFLRRITGDAMATMTDPSRLPDIAENVGAGVRSVVNQLTPGMSGPGSPLWNKRSRRRRLEVFSLPFEPVKAAAKRLGGTLNDFFVAGAAGGAARYHVERGASVERFAVTFVVSTRTGRGQGGNAFMPSKAVVPGAALSAEERFAAVHEVLGSRRSEVNGGGLLNGLAGAANLLPTSLTTRYARSQAAGVDFATSNVRAAPFDVYIAGAKALASYPIGPVAGTAWNITLMSYAGRLHLGLHLDPTAVPDADLLVRSLARAYEELLLAGGEEVSVSLTDW